MSFSSEWDVRYQENTHLSLWPFSDLVSLVMRHCAPIESCLTVLELGCGAGANIPFFQKLGVRYHALEGSQNIVQRLHRRFPALKPRIKQADFTREIPFDTNFDLVVDRGALTHNSTRAIERCLALVAARMASNALLIGVDWFSTHHDEYHRGQADDDKFTRTGYRSGPFAGVGRVHFATRRHLEDLFREFDILMLEEKMVSRHRPLPPAHQCVWNLVASPRTKEVKRS